MTGWMLFAQYGFAFVGLVVFAGEIGLPILIPGELALFVAGNMLVHSPAQLLVAGVCLALVDLVATTILHFVARGGGRLLPALVRRLHLTEKRPEDVLHGWRERLHAHDALMVFVLRLIPGIRMSPSLVTGLLRMPVNHFLLGAAPASVLWSLVPLTIGYAVRVQVGVVGVPDTRVLALMAIGAVATLLIAGTVWWLVHARDQHGDTANHGDHAAA